GDGTEGSGANSAFLKNTPVEINEAEVPIRILRYGLAADSGGAGKYRGGAPYRRDYRLLEREAILQVRADRFAIRPYGLYGGRAGKPGANYVDGKAQASKLTLQIQHGTIFRHELPGGGGWGDPLQRDPQAVLDDVRNGYVSAAAAHAEYGVIVDCESWRVDEQATAASRSEMCRGAPVPDVCWKDE
ncbi:MAG: hydantoinase B/oxoprolinase family protein, partial [Alphaproteobacteria bacterium]|nr:hydantoinase B/oxoprolinase family protein [Alphaproteobacteria bacterium]